MNPIYGVSAFCCKLACLCVSAAQAARLRSGLLMKRTPQDQSRKVRYRSPSYALLVIFLGCLLALGIAGLATPAGAVRSSKLVPNPSTPDAQARSADGVWSDAGQSGIANVQSQRVDISLFS